MSLVLGLAIMLSAFAGFVTPKDTTADAHEHPHVNPAATTPTLPDEEHVAPTTPTEPTPYDGVPVTPGKINSSNYRSYGFTDDNWSQYNGYYAIRDAKELYGFAALCKSLPTQVVTKKSVMGVVANAVLLSDIVINTSVDSSSNPHFWEPIGADGYEKKMFAGVFDGNGYSISGFYQNYTDTQVQYGGMFASIGCATVKNLVIKNSAFYAGVYGGSVISGHINASVIEGIRIDESVTLFADGASSGFAELEYITGAYDYAPSAKNVYVGTTVIGGAESLTGIIASEVHSSSYYENVYYKPGDLRPFANIYTTEREGSYASISKSSDAHVCAPIVHNQVNGTCYRSGLSAYSFCAVCEKILSGEKTVLYGHSTDEVFYAPSKTDSGRHDERCLECTELFGSADHRFNGRFDMTCEDCDFSIFTLNPSGTTYILSCENYTLTHSLHLSKSVTIPEGATFTVSEGITFTMGESITNRGTIINNGGIRVSTDYYGSGTVICGENAIYHPKFNEDGFCIFCENEKYPEEPPYKDEYYEISKIGHLMWFSNFVSAGNTSANARLTADIVFNEGDLSGLNGETDGYRLWVPIGMTMNHDTGIDSFVQYTGTFDGNGHTISGLYHFDYWSYAGNAGLFSKLGTGGVIKNVTVKDSYFATSSYVGAILGENLGGTVENCHNVNTTIASAARAGGIVGDITRGTVKNCTNTGTVKFFMVNPELAFYFEAFGGIAGNTAGVLEYCTNSGTISGASMSTVGGISGQVYQGIVRNNVNEGTINVSESGTNFGGITGYQYHATLSYNINYGTITAPGNLVGGVIGNPLGNGGVFTHNYTVNGQACGATSRDGCFAITEQELLDGRLAFELGIGQEIGVDARPYVGGPAVYAYFDTSGALKYTNDANYTCNHAGGEATCDAQAVCDGCRQPYGEIPTGAHEFKITGNEDMHYCLICGGRCGVVAPHSTNYIDYCAVCGDWIGPELAEDGFYEIDTFGNLMWFAQQVNAGNWALNARLISNITAKATFRTYQWVPIGGSSVSDTSVGYEGIFDGQGYTIALFPQDMLVEGDAVLGLFGTLKSGAVVKNLSVSNRVERTFSSNGTNYTYDGEHTVYFGVIAGRVLEGATVSGCRVANGTVSISNGVLGGIVGINYGTVENCVSYNMTLTGPEGRVGGIVGDYNGGTVVNSYTTHSSIGSTVAGYIGTAISSEAVSNERMASGEIAFAMNSYIDDVDFWYQAVGTGGPLTKSEYGNIGKIVYAEDFGLTTLYSNKEGEFTILSDFVIESGETLIIPTKTTLVIPEGVTLTNSGTLVKNGALTGAGTLDGLGSFIFTEIDRDALPVVEDIVYNGENHANEIVMAVNGVFSAFGKTFTADGFTFHRNFTDVIDVGHYRIGYITENEEYVVSFNVNPYVASEDEVSLEYTEAFYNGQALEPAVGLSGFDLELGKDYSVVYENNLSSGTATATIKFRGNFYGTFTREFVIKPVEIGTSATIELSENVTFTGLELDPVVIIVNGIRLVRDVDYTVTYENNIYPGTATAAVVGIGDVSGEANLTFTIVKPSFTVTVLDQVFPYNEDINYKPFDNTMYEGEGLVPGHTVILGEPLVSGGSNETITVIKILDANGIDVLEYYDLTVVATGKYHMFYDTYRWDNDGYHWRDCVYGCDEVADYEKHHGGTLTCDENAVCIDCGLTYEWATGEHTYDNGACTLCGYESGYVMVVDTDGNGQHSGNETGFRADYVHNIFSLPEMQFVVVKDFEGTFAGVGKNDTTVTLDFNGYTITMPSDSYGMVLQAENLIVTFKSSAEKGGLLVGYVATGLDSVTFTLDNVSHRGTLYNKGTLYVKGGATLNSDITNYGTIYLPAGYDLSTFTSYAGDGKLYLGEIQMVYNSESKSFECAENHVWNEADCDTAKTCGTCGKVEGEPLGHASSGPATCEDDEYCTRCGEVITEKLGHNTVTLPASEPTCEDVGYTEGSKCSVCGEIFVAQEEIPALGHKEAEAVRENIIGSDCSSAGSYDLVVYCSVCGEELSRTSHTVDSLGHNYVTVTVEATCVDDGYTVERCTVCGDEKNYTVLNATYQHYYEDNACIHCGDAVSPVAIKDEDGNGKLNGYEYFVTEDTLHMLFAESGTYLLISDAKISGGVCTNSIDVNVTLDLNGYRLETIGDVGNVMSIQGDNCNVTILDNSDEKSGRITGEAYVHDTCSLLLDGVDASALSVMVFENGVLEVKGDAKVSELVLLGIAKFPADYPVDDIIVTSESSGTVIHGEHELACEDGKVLCKGEHAIVGEVACEVTLECENCQYTEYIDHEYGDTYTFIEPNCEEAGEERADCKNCDHYISTTIDALGHNYSVAVLPPSCEEDGYTIHTCSACGDSYKDNFVSPTGHDEIVYPGSSPTCTGVGYTNGLVCRVCGEILEERRIIEPTGHNFVGDSCGQPTYCSVCNEAGGLLDHEFSEDGSCKYGCGTVVVAQVGNERYSELYKAVAALKAGDVLVIIANISITDVITIPEGTTVRGGDRRIELGYLTNYGTIESGTFYCSTSFENYGTISGGTFASAVNNREGGIVSGGTFNDLLLNHEGGLVRGGTYNERLLNRGTVENKADNPLVFGENGVWGNSGTLVCESHMSDSQPTCSSLPRCKLCNEKFGETLPHLDEDPANHVCDVCSAYLGGHVNELGNDHLCDVCNEVVSYCLDEDSDHYCDTCGEITGACLDNDYGYCKVCDLKIKGQSVNLGADISMKYFVEIFDPSLIENKTLEMRFEFLGKSTTLEGEYIDGYYVFMLEGIAPEHLGEKIDAYLLIDGAIVAEKLDYSVKTNLTNLLTKYSDDEVLVTLIHDLLAYGAAAQKAKDVNTDNLVTEGVENHQPSEREPEATTVIENNNDSGANIQSADIKVGDMAYMSFVLKLDNTDDVVIKLNGAEVSVSDLTDLGEGYYKLTTNGIAFVSVSDGYELEIIKGGESIAKMIISVESFTYFLSVEENASSPEHEALFLALYNLGKSAMEYIAE